MPARVWFLLLFLLVGGCRNSTPSIQDDDNLDTTQANDVNTLGDTPDDVDAPTDVANLPTRCIENWPVDPKATPSPSLPIDNAGQVIWTKEVPGGTYVGILAMAGDRLAYVRGNTLHILDRAGNLIRSVMEPSSFTGASGPVADSEGNFYFGNAEITSVTSNGEGRWHQTLGPNISFSAETTYTSLLTLSPDGILYFSATDGFLYALKASDGGLVWSRPVGLNANAANPFIVVVGVGDTLITEGGHYEATTGEVSALPMVDGTKFIGIFASYSRLFGFKIDLETYWWRIHAFDPCGELQWSFPTDKYTLAELIGFDDTIVATYGDEGFIYSANGEQQFGPAPLDARDHAYAIGADGTLYYTYCTELYNKDAGEMSVQAYSPSLELLWSVELGKPCLDAPPVLADDGVLYVLRSKTEQYPPHLELTAIQTASPGLAITAYPTIRSNNRRTGWIGGPQ